MSEQNDRLLELAGWCRHEWRQVGRHSFLCCKCDKWQGEAGDAAVGDGHEMDLEEMLGLIRELHGDAVSVHLDHEPKEGWAANVYGDGHDGKEVVDKYGGPADTHRAALGAAILAAEGGEIE